MPSLHFGWALLVGIMAYTSRRRFLRILGVLYPCCMASVIVITGHHYILDIIGGGTVVSLAYTLVKVIPSVTKDWASNSVNPYRDLKPTDARKTTRHARQNFAGWPRYQDIQDQRYERITSSLAFLIERRPPL